MITSTRSFGLLRLASFFMLATFFHVSTSIAAEKPPRSRQVRGTTSQQVHVSPRNRLRAPEASKPFSVSADSQRFEPPVRPGMRGGSPAPHEMEPVHVETVQQSGFAGSYASHCDPVCDCGECVTEIGCGLDQRRGFFEVGCGIESLFSRCHGCQSGCNECDGIMHDLPGTYLEGDGCGMELLGDCGCDACNPCNDEPTLLPRIRFNWCRYEFFAGVQGHTGPLNHVAIDTGNGIDRTGSGSFGFQYSYSIFSSFQFVIS